MIGIDIPPEYMRYFIKKKSVVRLVVLIMLVMFFHSVKLRRERH